MPSNALVHPRVAVAVVLETGQRVVGVVVRQLLVDLPAHALRLQALGIGGPGQAVLQRRTGARLPAGIVDHRNPLAVAAGLWAVVGFGPVLDSVGIGAAMQ